MEATGGSDQANSRTFIPRAGVRGSIKGSENALLEFTTGQKDCIEKIQPAVSNSLKRQKRENHHACIFASKLTSNWQKRRQITEAFLRDNQKYLPEHVRKCTPSQLTDSIEDLITHYLQSIKNLTDLASKQNYPRLQQQPH